MKKELLSSQTGGQRLGRLHSADGITHGKHLSPAGFIGVWLLIYAVVLVCGVCLSFLIVLNNNTDFLSVARRDLNYYTEHGNFNPEVIVNSADNLIYSADGEKYDALISADHGKDFDHDFYAQKYLPKVQSGKTVYTIIFNTDLQDNFAIAIAMQYTQTRIWPPAS
ncbi:MAG: hypothetical protein LUI39_13075 [Lachnospiraceae bacterium]|nr:hypothetical protein [Lachnospiraceae bacterium]